jgi:hypothetical protein
VEEEKKRRREYEKGERVGAYLEEHSRMRATLKRKEFISVLPGLEKGRTSGVRDGDGAARFSSKERGRAIHGF